VVFLDIGLPGLSGHEVASRIRRDLGMEQVYLIALSGYGTEEDRRKSFYAGFDSHLVKPLDRRPFRASSPPRSAARRPPEGGLAVSRLHLRLLGDDLPARDFAPDEGREVRGASARRLEAVGREQLLQLVALQHFVQVAAQPLDDLARQAFRAEDAVPVRDFPRG
jgi:CheY-like chemotaxis protein